MTDALNEGATVDEAPTQPTPAASTEPAAAPETKAPAAPATEPVKAPDAKQPAAKTIATGADTVEETPDKPGTEDKAEPPVDRNELTEDLRKAIAAHYAAGDKKLEAKEMKRLERIKDIKSLWGMYRELEGKFTSGGLVKVPGKDAKPEEISAFAKALGWTEKPEEMLGQIKLENGVVIGDADKPALTGFLQAVHGATSAQDFASKATNWYYKNQEDAAAALDEADDTFRRDSEKVLKDELGPAFKRSTNAIASVFATAPGGTDLKNDKSLYARLMGGRTADGRVIGNDPDMVRWLVAMAHEFNPAATVVEGGDQAGKSIDQEIAEIEKVMRTDRRTYNQKYATRFGELLAAREKIQARNRA